MSVLPNYRRPTIAYPDSDGKRMAENTLQFEVLVSWKENIEALFADQADVFVAGDLLWYPVKGHPEICQAPDVMVAFGRPKGYRGSYKQFEEDNIPFQVVAEILSPNNTYKEMMRKLAFYETYGAEEYYVYDPDKEELNLYQRQGGVLQEIANPNGWVSPRLNIRFETTGGKVVVFGPDGKPFQSMGEIIKQKNSLEKKVCDIQAERDRLLAKLRELGVDPQS